MTQSSLCTVIRTLERLCHTYNTQQTTVHFHCPRNLTSSSMLMKSCLSMTLAVVLMVIMLAAVDANFWHRSKCEAPCVPGTEALMSRKEHGTSHTSVQTDLRWGCDVHLADQICNFNRRYAEVSGYWVNTALPKAVDDHRRRNGDDTPMMFYDSNTGRLLFQAPIGRSWEDFLNESRKHGWPSFRDSEVNWTLVRVLPNGETVSLSGTHLGHNLPDKLGNRYCINLVSIAGNPEKEDEEAGRRMF